MMMMMMMILTTIDMCTRFPEAIPLKDIHTSTAAEALLEIFSRVGLIVDHNLRQT